MITQLRFNLRMNLKTLITIAKIQMERSINQVGMDKNILSNNHKALIFIFLLLYLQTSPVLIIIQFTLSLLVVDVFILEPTSV